MAFESLEIFLNNTCSIVIKDNHYDSGNYCEPLRGIEASKNVRVDANTPPSLGPDGSIYTENDRILFVVGQ